MRFSARRSKTRPRGGGALLAVVVTTANFVALFLHWNLLFFQEDTTEAEISLSISQENSTCSSTGKLRGKHVVLLDVHLEGNLGDIQETLPVVKHLKSCGVARITAVLSNWKPTLVEKMHSRTVQVQGYIDEFQTFESQPPPSSSTIVVVAPGPWKICELTQKWTHKIDIFLGGSFMWDPLCNEHSEWESKAWAVVKASRLVVVREPASYKLAEEKQIPSTTTSLLLGADFSYSLEINKASQAYWKQYYDHYSETYLVGRKSNAREAHGADTATKPHRSVIFSRNNNFGRGVRISHGDQVLLKVPNRSVVNLPLSDVIFATSSDIEDAGHFAFLQKTYRGLHDAQMIQCQSIEQLFGLLSSTLVDHVYTDRYHPGVAAHLQGKSFSVLDYPAEQIKLDGLAALTASTGTSNHNTAQSLKAMNDQAFQMLDAVISVG